MREWSLEKKVVISALALFPAAAFAYLDPGSVNFAIQAVIGSLIGALYALKLYWTKIKSMFQALLKGPKK